MRTLSLTPALLCALAVVLALPAVAAAQGPAGLRADWQKGANVTAWWHDAYAKPAADDAVTALAATGSTHGALVTTWYMADGTSSEISPHAQKTPSDASLASALAAMRAAGLQPVLKPHVDVWDGTFRGAIAPADPGAWFADYRAMMLHYADLAEHSGVALLEIGTELSTMTRYESEWRSLIAAVRERFSGELTFAANWVSGAEEVAFWDALDYIGLDAYMPLVEDEANPSIETIERAWHDRGYVAAMARLHERWAKPVLITEVGYQSREWTAAVPFGGAWGALSHEAQQRAVEAALRVWAAQPWVAGMYWWDWPAVSYDAATNNTYPLRGKPAQQTISDWNRTVRAPDPPPAPEPVTETPAPAPAPAPAPRLGRIRLGLADRGVRRLRLRVAAPAGCPVAVRVARRAPARWRHVGTRRLRAARASKRELLLTRLRPGTVYRVEAAASGETPCAQSARVRFRTKGPGHGRAPGRASASASPAA